VTILEITIQRKAGNIWPVVLERSQTGELPLRAEGELDLDVDWREQLLTFALDPLAYGTVLGKALFRDSIRDAFVTARNESGDNLRTLFVVEDAELRPLHWERLCAPIRAGGKWGFLGMDQRSVFSLYLPSLTDRRFPAIGRRDLRALILVANPPEGRPYDLDRFDEPATAAGIHTVLEGIPHDLLASTPDAVGRPTLDELVKRITGQTYTLLHIVAHGWFNEARGETVIFLLDDVGHIKPVTASHLIKRLEMIEGNLGLPRLTFLATCESATPEAEHAGALGGLAQRLVRELGLPAVVAMTEKVSVTTATALGKAFYIRLRNHGEADRALVQATAELAQESDITVPALYSRLAGRPLFSDTLDRELTGSEIAFGLDQLAALLPERAPVLQPEFDEQAERLRNMLGAGRDNLSEPARKAWDQTMAAINATSEESLNLSFRALALGKEPPAYDARCPFPGLLAFGARFATSGKPQDDDRKFFFGREKLINDLMDRLRDHPFLAVLGGSGSGKSSLVLAGLVPALQKEQPGLQMSYMTPGDDPVTRLDTALENSANQPSGELQSTSILVVDQFEELFRLTQSDDMRRAFIQRLLELAESQFVVLTMRADFWGDCAPYPALKEAMTAHQILIAPMTTAELRSAMEQQAAAAGLHFEADLSNTILDTVQDEPGAMPLLQHLLLEMWKRRHGRWLRASEYRELGGIRKAIAYTADGVYATLSPTEQMIMQNIFVRLTRLDEETISGQERRDTRRRVALTELISARQDAPIVRSLVHRLADADTRLVVISPTEEVEVAHEALLRYWSTLQGWLNQDRQSLLLRDEVSQAAKAWERTGRDDYLRHRGSRLRQVVALRTAPAVDLNPSELAYIQACEKSAWSVIRIKIQRTLHDDWLVIADCIPAGASLPIRTSSRLLVDDVFFGELEPLAYATHLGQLLFQADTYRAFVLASGVANGQLRVTLQVEDPTLESVHWELLGGPVWGGTWGLLAFEEGISYSFHVPSSISFPSIPVNRENLRALLLVASPKNLKDFDLPDLDTRREIALVRNALGDVPCDVLAEEPNAIGSPTLDALCRNLTTRRYDLLHITAYAMIQEDTEQNSIFLTGSDGLCDPVSDDRLVEQLGYVASQGVLPRFIYLCSGYSGQRLAQRLVRDLGIPAVLGLVELVTQGTLHKSIRSFYSILLTHGFVDRALADTRASLRDQPDTRSLVLYSRLGSGQLFSEQTVASLSERSETTLEITILAEETGDNIWPVNIEQRLENEWCKVHYKGSLQLDPTELVDLNNPYDYGVFLGRALFQAVSGEVFKKLQEGNPVCFTLCVEPTELARLHWEWLCMPNDSINWRFLAELPKVRFSLQVNSAMAVPTQLRERKHLKALTLIAGGAMESYDLVPIDVDKAQSGRGGRRQR